jgi:arylsulfatase A-like enzyme
MDDWLDASVAASVPLFQIERSAMRPAIVLTLVLVSFAAVCFAADANDRPNVILILTDDQGYGEVAAHGNPIIKTPNMDELHAQSVRLTDYHVDPTCSPTRSALLTGRYSTRTGVWHTINGRSMINPRELTLAEVFKANGYRTGMIGKWHLGDNYPCRPDDQGFEHAVWHHGGGIGNGPDYWENDYYDDTFTLNGKFTKFEGYCTDVWFDQATKFVEKHQDEPFFLYLATNAPHGPYIVPDKYAALYKDSGMPPTMAKFYGMITCIDENLGRFRKRLEELGLAENTLLVFMTDNGTTAGWIDQKAGYKYFNAGMRAWKGFQWDGGHRVPCFFHWPKGKLTGGRDVDTLSAHIDFLPTLVDLLDLKKPDGPESDGVSLKPLLLEEVEELPPRTLFAHVQRANKPPKWESSAVMTKRWRLVDGKELHDMAADPGQQKDVAAAHPEVVAQLRADYEGWWKSLEPAIEQTVRYGLGGLENPMTLASHDWLMPGVDPAAWHQVHVERGMLKTGSWAVTVEKSGKYEITLHRWAPYLNKPMGISKARLRVGAIDEEIEVASKSTGATFQVELTKGPAMLMTTLTRPDGKQHSAYYVKVRYVE